MSTKIKIGIVGGAGYTGGELLRILVNHPNADIVFVHSNSNAGNPIYKVHTDLIGSTDLVFSSELSSAIDVLFLCVGHGDASKFLDANPIESHIKIIDLSQDFRIEKEGNDFVYGLPELQRDKIKNAKNIANPGCFATCIQLGLLPLAANKVLESDIHVSGITGSTGAGQSLSQTSHFSWRNNNMSVYKALNHQHLKEIGQTLKSLQASLDKEMHFIPYRGDFTRGIIATMYTPCPWTLEEAKEKYKAYYAAHPFTHVMDENIDLKQVVNTNNCLLYLEKHGDQLMIVSIIDNLLKGASGHAVQNMNLMFGLEETAGLRLKAGSF
ncbi:N-acetyl-gamma-glutamyl-phosphate reductase [uncultured Cytophaga sp.]|uniref:N-acetyl-gamma-glutamyl-phosphate reductase n=1 Tax=uncultured Cytophaga sp. TaxID=160238 RepID=UPI002615FC0C|nr:N-acetyl-gamma-glutamyl-phosphate reductase [uncultured Cytophaga sp.]